MATYVLPNIVTGGSVTVQGNSLSDAQNNAAKATGVTPSQQAAAKTFGGEGGQGSVESGGSSGVKTGSSGSPSGPSQNVGTSTADLNSSIDRLLGARAAGDHETLMETIREWDQKYGLDRDQFNEGIRQYNQNYLISQAGLTGQFQGAPTMQAQQQAYAQQMGVIAQAAAMQASPFRQQQVLGQAGRLLSGMPTAGFQAPNIVSGVGTAGGNTQGGLGYLQQMVDDIKNPTPNQTTADSFLANTPTPNKLDSASFLRSAPSTQNVVLQAMQEKYGIDPNDALNQIKNTLPQFQAPTVVGAVRR